MNSYVQQIHCGCIVSFHMFVLLDAGGIECITCARKSFILVREQLLLIMLSKFHFPNAFIDRKYFPLFTLFHIFMPNYG